MERAFDIPTERYDIPAIVCLPEEGESLPGIILCHGTGANKNEVKDLFARLAKCLAERGVASLRFDFAGCGESKADMLDFSFMGEVADARAAYDRLCSMERIDRERIGILGFSQGARVMAQLMSEDVELACAVSWSGACHNGAGVFDHWFKAYYDQAKTQGYARIPMGWREDMLLSLSWFDQILDTRPLDCIHSYQGPLLAVAGTADPIVPWEHAKDILAQDSHPLSRLLVFEGADHIYNALDPKRSRADELLKETADWVSKALGSDKPR